MGRATKLGSTAVLVFATAAWSGAIAAGAAAEGSEPAGGGTSSGCLGSALEWGPVGGLVFFTSRSEVTPCRRFEFERVYRGTGEIESCASVVPCASADQVDMADLLAALAHEDVAAAFEEVPGMLGLDTRPVDAPVLEITRDARSIQVGAPCSEGSTGCRKIPPGVAALVDLLRALQDERLAEGDCAQLRR